MGESVWRMNLERILEAIPAGLIVLDKNGCIVFVNAVTEKLTGLPRDYFIGQPYNAFKITTVDGKPIRDEDRPFVRVMKTGKPVYNVELAVERPDGIRVTLSISEAPLRDEKGDILYVILSFTDITERKRLEEKFKLFFETVEEAPDGVQIVDLDGYVIYSNKAVEGILGFSPGELRGRHVNEMNADPGFASRVILPSIAKTGKWAGELMVKHKDGRVFPVWLATSMVKDSKGNPVALIGILRDITERKRIEEELKFKSLLLDGATDSVLVVELDGRMIYVNEAAYRARGYTKDELMAMRLQELDAPEYAELIKPRIESLMKKGSFVFESAHIKKDGTVMPVEVHARIIEYGGRRVISGVVRDITERKRVERALRESEERFRKVFEKGPIGIAITGPDYKFVRANPRLSQMLGYTEEELKKLTFPEVTYPEDIDKDVSHAQRLFTGEIPFFTIEKRYIRKNGEIFWASISVTVVRDEKGDILYGLGMVEDITERKQTEARLKEEKRLSDALNDINAAITSTLDFDEIMQRVVVESAKAIGSETASILLREDGRWSVAYIYGFPQEVIGIKFSDEEHPHAVLAAKTKRPVVINDAYNDERIKREIMEKYNIRSVTVIPLVVRGEVIGALFFNYHSAPAGFTYAQVDFASKVAASASLSLENARLFQRVESDRRDLEILNEIGLNITSGLDLKTLMVKTAENVKSLIGADAAGIVFWDEEKHEITDVFFIGIPEHIAAVLKSKPSVTKSIIESGKPGGLVEDYPSQPAAIREFIDIGVKNGVVVPIISKGRILGAIHALGLSQERRFSEADVRLLESAARPVAIALENARLYEAERSIADTLQEALLAIPEKIEGVEFGHLYRSATETTRVGGDFYDIFELEHGRAGIVIGDVSGKGLQAATLTSLVKNTIKAYAYQGDSPALIMSRVNDVVGKESGPGTFVTVFFGVLDTNTGNLIYCSAGHPPGILKKGTSEISLLATSSPAVGAFAGLNYITDEVALEKGDVLILYTDGVTEARCDTEFFGEERLIGFIRGLKPTPAKGMPMVIFDETMECTGGKLSDDVALLCVSLGANKLTMRDIV